MIEINRILCPVDFSEYSRHALDCAVALARWYGSQITALHVFPHRPPAIVPFGLQVVQPGALPETDRDVLLRHLEAFIEEQQRDNVRIEARLQEAPEVSREILRQADVLKADLVVIASHGRSGFERLLLGSITEKILRKSACPVMVVPPRLDGAPASGVSFKEILCPVDFSAASLRALTYAMSLAEESDGRLTAVHVIEVPPELYASPMPDFVNVAELRAAAEAESLRRLRALIPEAVRTYCTVETVVAEGRASREILQLAANRKTDLIVMGVQGRGAFDLLMFGSNTHHVIRAAACPVLTIHAK
jgi:nucleotide-binding universal stress UspA family protein